MNSNFEMSHLLVQFWTVIPILKSFLSEVTAGPFIQTSKASNSPKMELMNIRIVLER